MTTRSRQTTNLREPTVLGTAPVQLNPHPHCRVTAEFLPVTMDTGFACSRTSQILKYKEHTLFSLLLLLSTMFLRFIYTDACINNSFLCEWYPIIWIGQIDLTIHLPVFIWVTTRVWLR